MLLQEKCQCKNAFVWFPGMKKTIEDGDRHPKGTSQVSLLLWCEIVAMQCFVWFLALLL